MRGHGRQRIGEHDKPTPGCGVEISRGCRLIWVSLAVELGEGLRHLVELTAATRVHAARHRVAAQRRSGRRFVQGRRLADAGRTRDAQQARTGRVASQCLVDRG